MTAELSLDVVTGPIRGLQVPVTTVDVTLIQADCVLFGWSLRETTGAAVATVEIQDGGAPLGEIGLAASGVDTKWFGPFGIHVSGKITAHIVAGSVTGVVYVAYSN